MLVAWAGTGRWEAKDEKAGDWVAAATAAGGVISSSQSRTVTEYTAIAQYKN